MRAHAPPGWSLSSHVWTVGSWARPRSFVGGVQYPAAAQGIPLRPIAVATSRHLPAGSTFSHEPPTGTLPCGTRMPGGTITMASRPPHTHTGPRTGPSGQAANRQFVKYTFFKVAPSWRGLPADERAVMKQEI